MKIDPHFTLSMLIQYDDSITIIFLLVSAVCGNIPDH